MRLSKYSEDVKGSGKDPELTPAQELGFILAKPRLKRHESRLRRQRKKPLESLEVPD